MLDEFEELVEEPRTSSMTITVSECGTAILVKVKIRNSEKENEIELSSNLKNT